LTTTYKLILHLSTFSFCYHERHEITRKSLCSKKYIAISKLMEQCILACFISSNNTLLVNLASLRNNCVELSAPQHDCQYALFHKFLVSCLFHRKKQENKSFNGNAFLCIFSCIFVPFVVVIFLLILYGCGSAALCSLWLNFLILSSLHSLCICARILLVAAMPP